MSLGKRNKVGDSTCSRPPCVNGRHFADGPVAPVDHGSTKSAKRSSRVASGSRSLGLTTFISHLIGEEILQCLSHLSVGTCQVGRFLLCKIFFWAGDNPISETITQLKSQS